MLSVCLAINCMAALRESASQGQPVVDGGPSARGDPSLVLGNRETGGEGFLKARRGAVGSAGKGVLCVPVVLGAWTTQARIWLRLQDFKSLFLH